MAIDPRTPTTVYAGTDDRGILKSVDGGGTWSPVNTGLTNHIHALGLPVGVRVLAIDPLTPTTVYAGTAAGVFKSMDGGAFWSPTGLIQHSPLVSLSFSPTIVTGGIASTGTVTLNAAAPVGGAVVTLASSNTGVATVPASVTVAAGTTSANFTVSTSPVTASTMVMISAAFDDAVRSAALTVGPALAYLGLNPNGVAGGIASTGLVVLGAPAPIDGAIVTLSSSNPAVATVPTSVTVAAGVTSANFTVSTSAVTTPTMVTISGAYGGDTKSALLNVVPTTLSSLSLSSTSVPAGSTSTGTVTLSVPAPVGGAVVTLSSGNTAVATVPASVTVAAGATSANFTVSTNSVLPPTYVSIIVAILGANGGVTRYDYLQVTLPAATTLSSLSLDPNSVTGGSTSAGMVTLSAPAPSAGAVVTLSSSNTAVATVPASVTVAAGTTKASFTVSTGPLNTCTLASVTISGTYNGGTRSADLTIAPATVDTINIQQTDYFASKQELRVAAKSSNSSATLRVHVTLTGELIGTLTKGGDGTYRGQFKWPGNPMSITVQSSLCGSATSAVRSK